MIRALVLTAALLAAPLDVIAAPAALGPYPEDRMERLDWLLRCAGLARAVQSSGFDIGYYEQFIGVDFARKDTKFARVAIAEVMQVFGFDPADIEIMDEGRNQLPHVRIVFSGTDVEINATRGFYETMSLFRKNGTRSSFRISRPVGPPR